jgi:hypothetical protein
MQCLLYVHKYVAPLYFIKYAIPKIGEIITIYVNYTILEPTFSEQTFLDM